MRKNYLHSLSAIALAASVLVLATPVSASSLYYTDRTEQIHAGNKHYINVEEGTVKASKDWTINFSVEMNHETINKDTLYIVNQDGERFDNVEIETGYKWNTDHRISYAKVVPVSDYPNGTYTLRVSEGVQDSEGNPLAKAYTKEFTVDVKEISKEALIQKDYMNMTLKELKRTYGEFEGTKRVDGIGGIGFDTTDYVGEYHEYINEDFDYGYVDPIYFKDLREGGFVTGSAEGFRYNYPRFEVVGVNGVAYKDSEYYHEKFAYPEESNDPSAFAQIDRMIPYAPHDEEEGFLIDIKEYSPEHVIYHNDEYILGDMQGRMYVENDEPMIPLKAFAGAKTVEINEANGEINGHEFSFVGGTNRITVDGTTYKIKELFTKKDGLWYVPIMEIAPYLDLTVRANPHPFKVVQISNEPLEINEEWNFNSWTTTKYGRNENS